MTTSLTVSETSESKKFLLVENNGEDFLIDALPYVDSYATEDCEEVRELVHREMQSFKPHDYLARLQVPSTPLFDAAMQHVDLSSSEKSSEDLTSAEKSSLCFGWQREIHRVKTQGGHLNILDATRYELRPQSATENNDISSWKLLIRNARSQVENSRARQITLKLLRQVSQTSWQRHLSVLQGSHAVLQKKVEALKSQIETVNKRRKLEQVTGANTLRLLASDYKTICEKNMILLPIVHSLAEEIQRN